MTKGDKFWILIGISWMSFGIGTELLSELDGFAKLVCIPFLFVAMVTSLIIRSFIDD